MALLELANIRKSFEGVRALHDVSFDLQAAEVHAVVGENGAGKSTLIRIITGAVQPDSGTIRIEGNAASHLTPASAHAAGVAAVYQQPALFADLTVAENIALRLDKPSAVRCVRSEANRSRAGQLLQRINAQIDPDWEVRRLSMPQQQLVEIACALGAGARILIMDEPTSSLPAGEVDLLLGLIDSLRGRGVGIIYVSHRLDEVFRIANRVTVLRDGQSVGTRLIAAPRQLESSEGEGSKAQPLTEADLIRMMIGREVSTIFPPPETVGVASEPILSVQDLGCTGSGVRGVTFEVRAGEVLGFAGLVGAGRTELARILFGITPADSGTITIAGKTVKIASPQDAIKSDIAYVPEDRRRHGVILPMSVAANLTLAIHERIFPRRWLRPGVERAHAKRWIQDLGIKTPSEEMAAANLSGGNQQKVALARWLAADPKLLILDEPTQGVDVAAKAEIHKLIRRLAAQGIAVLMMSSDLPEILGMSDRIAVMRGGAIVSIVEGKTATAHSIMATAVDSGGT